MKFAREKPCFEMSSLLLSWRYTLHLPRSYNSKNMQLSRNLLSRVDCCSYTPKNLWNPLKCFNLPQLRIGWTANEPFYSMQEFPPGHNLKSTTAEVGQNILTAANPPRLQQDKPAELWKCSLSLNAHSGWFPGRR